MEPNHFLFSQNLLISQAKFFFREIFVFAKVFANKLVFSKLIKTFRGNTKTKIFVLTLPSNGAAWHDTAPQCWLPECRTGAAWQLEIGELEPHDMMLLRNADCCNADYRNSDYRNANYRNADYRNADYRSADDRNADYRNVGLSGIQSVRYRTEKD
jgi:hypothetical protein